jgi:transposase InsO family protein
MSVLKPGKRPKKPKCYNRPVPGDRVQIDTCKIGKGLIQFTAVDDCTRLRVLGLYDAKTAKNSTAFLEERLLQEFPFPIQRIQTDRGCEFVAFEFQDALRKHHIKFRPNRPAAPHLNGKVERSQRTDRMEFWATVDRSVGRDALRPQVQEWQRFYNEERTHSSLGGKPPTERLKELQAQIPTRETVRSAYDPEKEVYVTNRNYSWQPA